MNADSVDGQERQSEENPFLQLRDLKNISDAAFPHALGSFFCAFKETISTLPPAASIFLRADSLHP